MLYLYRKLAMASGSIESYCNSPSNSMHTSQFDLLDLQKAKPILLPTFEMSTEIEIK